MDELGLMAIYRSSIAECQSDSMVTTHAGVVYERKLIYEVIGTKN